MRYNKQPIIEPKIYQSRKVAPARIILRYVHLGNLIALFDQHLKNSHDGRQHTEQFLEVYLGKTHLAKYSNFATRKNAHIFSMGAIMQ